MGKKKLSVREKWLKFAKNTLPIILAFVLVIGATFGVTMAYFGQSSGPLSTDITLKTGVKIGSTSSIAGSTDKVVPSQPVTISATAVVEPADNKTTTITDAILRAKVRTTTEEDINLQISTTAVTVGTKTGYWVEHTDGYFYLCAETKNSTVGNTKLLVFNPGTEGVSVSMSGTFTVPNTITNEMGGEPLNVIATFEVAQGELYTSGSTTRIPDASMTIANEIVQEVFGSLVTTYEVGDIITFGEYPQTLMAANMEEPTQVIDATGFNGQPIYLGSDGNRYVKKRLDLSSRGISVEDITTFYECGMFTSSNGQVMTDNTDHYFKIEAIEWRILSINSGVAQVMATKVLDAGSYQSNYVSYNSECYLSDGAVAAGTEVTDETHIIKDNGKLVYASNYKHSQLRSFLNGEFYNSAFSDSDEERIVTTSVDNGVDSTTGVDGVEEYCCENTMDKVYVLSYADFINTEYGFKSNYNMDINRMFKATDYSLVNGAMVMSEEFMILIFGANDRAGLESLFVNYFGVPSDEVVECINKACESVTAYLMRTPMAFNDISTSDGNIHAIWLGGVDNCSVDEEGGILPAMQITL